jgi:hypothetical protein
MSAGWSRVTHLSFYGNTLYQWNPVEALPPAYTARKKIKAGELVYCDPADPKSDISVIWEIAAAGYERESRPITVWHYGQCDVLRISERVSVTEKRD